MRKIVFWDFDGTLSHTGSIWGINVRDTMNEYADGVDLDTVRMHLRRGYTWQTPDVPYTETGDLWWEKLLLHISGLYDFYGIPKGKHAEISAKIRARMISPDTYVLFEDAIDTLRECINLGAENYIISNNYPELPNVVMSLGVGEYISGYTVSAQIGFEKPHQGIFLHALSLANADITRDICVMVGDNPAADMEGGKNFGFTTVYAHKTKLENPCEFADYYASELREIPKILCSHKS